MNFLRSRFAIMLLLAAMAVAGACAPNQTATPAAKLVPFPGTPTLECLQAEILPQITEIQPEDVRPGSEVTVIARGGYFRDNCGGYNESARVYQIYLDDEPVADLQCYVNHCEGKFVLSESTTSGVHCMGVQKGTCQVKFEVAGE